VDPEFADLVPLFVEEARDRLERLATSVPRLESDPQSAVEAKRELHTLKGAVRMLRLSSLAELCHAAEEVLHAPRPGLTALMTRVVDELSAMVEAVARGDEAAADPELLRRLAEGTGGAPPASPHQAAWLAPLPQSPPAPLSPSPPSSGAAEPPPETAPARNAGAHPARGIAGEIRVETAALDAVAERATQVRIMALSTRPVIERIYELARLAEEGVREPQPTQVLAVLATLLRRVAVELEGGQRRLLRSAEEQLEKMLSLQLQPLRGSLQSLARYARELARSLQREVEVELEGEDTRLDRRIARELEDALLHVVRNAVDHGIESPEVREARGKPRAGRLQIRASAEGARVRLVIADDGGGIDPVRVLQRAVEAGLVDRASTAGFGKAEALRLLFAPGFSTRRTVSEISGRGIGLDVVAAAVNRVGGEVFLDSEPRQGTTLALEVPVARRGEQVLLLRVGQLRLAIPSSLLRRATWLPAGAVVERDGRALALLADDRLVPFVPLARLYGQPSIDGQLLLEGVVSGQPIALAVDEVEGEEEVLVRPMPPAIGTDRLLEGIALLASGEPVGVLSPSVLAQREYLRALPIQPERPLARRVRVLLVDDSLVTREMERRLLDDAGFDVAAVGDADEALARLAEQTFDCLVTDVEMPGMDGFALTAHLRGMERYAHLPIIVVSTRDRPEDRLRGLKVGADAYLTKQSLDAGELVDLLRRLGGGR
jgi:chemotaxis protein histidine kinase CheA/CheY-like chemotaxis protein